MRLVYLAPADIQVARVDRQCIVHFCSALQRMDVEVELVALRISVMPGEAVADDPLALYRVHQRFKLRLVRVPVRQESSAMWLALNRLIVHWSETWRHAFGRADHLPLVFYTKTYSTAAILIGLRRVAPTRPLVVFEAHLPPRNRLQRWVLRRADRVIANTFALARDLVQEDYVASHKVLGTHQGVEAKLLQGERPSQASFRAKLGLPLDKKLIVYTGKIYNGYPEVEYMLEAAKALEHRTDIVFILVGGRADHVSHYRRRVAAERNGNTSFVGFVAPADVQDYQFAADVLTMYYPSGLELNRYRSPGKLFEYMASGRPIVTANLPILAEVLGDPPAAALVPPDSPAALAREIVSLIDDDARAEGLAADAQRRVAAFTWEERARAVVEFIQSG